MSEQAGGAQSLSRASRVWRVVALLAVAVGITAGTLGEDDRSWPFSPMTQFAFKVDPNSEIHSLGLEADDTSGARVTVPLGGGGIGLERAEIEGQATRIEAEPHRLQAVAVMYADHAPHAPRLTKIYLVDTVSKLRDSEVVSKSQTTKTTWTVRHPGKP
ncbi:hypothetical protein [Luteipulveratus mongoliensis]|uniref:hypothetical protein n=1 Tax=Luteipulveratus mongoliensis TaxID=571913 RepID=UPI0012EE065C|nr:hypothetical protein [Luteipulveratus mongoliensis]